MKIGVINVFQNAINKNSKQFYSTKPRGLCADTFELSSTSIANNSTKAVSFGKAAQVPSTPTQFSKKEFLKFLKDKCKIPETRANELANSLYKSTREEIAKNLLNKINATYGVNYDVLEIAKMVDLKRGVLENLVKMYEQADILALTGKTIDGFHIDSNAARIFTESGFNAFGIKQAIKIKKDGERIYQAANKVSMYPTAITAMAGKNNLDYSQVVLMQAGQINSYNALNNLRYRSLFERGEDGKEPASMEQFCNIEDAQDPPCGELLSDEDKINLVTFDLLKKPQIARYIKLIEQTSLEPYEIALATKFDLSDEQINLYSKLKGVSISWKVGSNGHEYNISDDELMGCIKAELNKEQMIRFAQLRLKKQDFTNVTVRRQGEEQYQPFEYIIKCIKDGLTDEQIDNKARLFNFLATASNGDIKSKMPEDFWYKTGMGCEKETFDVIKKAISTLVAAQNSQITLQETPYEVSTKNLNKNGNNFASSENGGFEFFGKTKVNSKGRQISNFGAFNVLMSQFKIDGKTVLHIKDTNSSNEYISYNGAIAKVKNLPTYDRGQFESWGNLYKEKQSDVLLNAASIFPFDLFNGQGECIIAKGPIKRICVGGVEEIIETPFYAQNKSDGALKRYYMEQFLELNKNKKLTAQNVLRLVPKDAMLSINPINSNGILSAIAAEWFSADGNRWQLEVHSQNLKFPDDGAWVARLHYQTITDAKDFTADGQEEIKRHYFQFEPNTRNKASFNGTFEGGKSHIKINSPLGNGDLLDNEYFQRVIQDLSTEKYKNDAISSSVSNMAETLGIFYEGGEREKTLDEISEYCLKHPWAFNMYKDIVDDYRIVQGRPILV